MAAIEIHTTQNVAISFPLASLRQRMLAWFLDMFFILCVCIGILYAVAEISQGSEESMMAGLYLLVLPYFFFYTLAWETFANGQTPGKRALRLRVMRLDGRKAGFPDYLLRWTFRLADIWISLGALAAMLISTSERSQRLGDLLSGMVVLQVKPSSGILLADILRIRTMEDHVPQYPEIKQLREEDLILLKQVLDRYDRYRNKAHEEVLHEAARKVSYLIGLKEVPADKSAFLKACIQDYIVLTR